MTSSTEISAAIFEEVKGVVMVTLDIEDQADDLGPETGLYGNFAELDSLTVVKLIIALRKRFGIEIHVRRGRRWFVLLPPQGTRGLRGVQGGWPATTLVVGHVDRGAGIGHARPDASARDGSGGTM